MLIGFVTFQEEPWAVTAVKEEEIDETIKEEKGDCMEG
jgi:hypothetical protein